MTSSKYTFFIFETMKRNLLKSVFSGLLLTFAWPIDGFPILIFVAFVPLLHILFSNASLNKRTFYGLIFLAFFIWNLGISWWIWNASAFGMWFAVIVNTTLMTLVFMMARYIYQKLSPKSSLLFVTTFWMSFELLHLHWEFSWPWLQLGNVFSESTLWIQWYEYTGVFGGSLWIWIVNILFFKATLHNTFNTRIAAYALVSIAIPISISLLIYNSYNAQTEKSMEVVIAQPNIDPYNEKFVTSDLEQCKSLFRLVSPHIKPSTDIILAPETYFTEGYGVYLPRFQSSILHRVIEESLGESSQTQLLTGIQFYNIYDEANKTVSSNQYDTKWVDFYNSAFLSGNGPLQVYHKSKLVVGVENLPYKNIIEPILGNIMIDLGGTVSTRAADSERKVFETNNGTRLAPIICYESVYGSFVTGFVRNGAQLLAVMTNDAWWGETPGHRQLLSYTKLRAIETRLPVVRSANTGISAIIDPRGEITQQIPYLERSAISATIYPQNIFTFYVKYGDYIGRLSLLVSGLLLLLAFARKKTDL